jgi:hypothetical protein
MSRLILKKNHVREQNISLMMIIMNATVICNRWILKKAFPNDTKCWFLKFPIFALGILSTVLFLWCRKRDVDFYIFLCIKYFTAHGKFVGFWKMMDDIFHWAFVIAVDIVKLAWVEKVTGLDWLFFLSAWEMRVLLEKLPRSHSF